MADVQYTPAANLFTRLDQIDLNGTPVQDRPVPMDLDRNHQFPPPFRRVNRVLDFDALLEDNPARDDPMDISEETN